MTKASILISTLSLLLGLSSIGQTTVTLKPGSEGHDAYLRSIGPDVNYGNHYDLLAHAWTHSGSPVTVRAVFKFDLSSLPPDINIIDAQLSLFSIQSENSNGTHSTLSGSNEARLFLVSEPWDEQTVTWADQPSIIIDAFVPLPESQFSIEDYTGLDVTEFVQQWVDSPEDNHGFRFQLEDETFYRRMLFASSDHPNSDKHPELGITYELNTGIPEEEEQPPFSLASTIASDYVIVNSNSTEAIKLDVVDSRGRILLSEWISPQSSIQIDSNDWSQGIYHFRSGSTAIKVLKN
ncbi:MAG: DNRLRE domain-containing protein [Flavobacteriales bacterium]|nr:DNRLRE domain-containing protein [Flavobacteriales bacterium]